VAEKKGVVAKSLKSSNFVFYDSHIQKRQNERWLCKDEPKTRRVEKKNARNGCENGAHKIFSNIIIHVLVSLGWLSLLLGLDAQAAQALREQTFRSIPGGITSCCAIKGIPAVTGIVFIEFLVLRWAPDASIM
jgi:hypothetical protein